MANTIITRLTKKVKELEQEAREHIQELVSFQNASARRYQEQEKKYRELFKKNDSNRKMVEYYKKKYYEAREDVQTACKCNGFIEFMGWVFVIIIVITVVAACNQ